MGKKLLLLLGFVGALLLFVFGAYVPAQRQEEKAATPSVLTPTVIAEQKITYKGREGRNALALLKEIATVKQESSGLVVAINNRKADDKKREYWSFYVNGTPAQVGPEQYVTKDSDVIEWKIEKY